MDADATTPAAMRLQLVSPRQGALWVRRGFAVFVKQPMGFAGLFATFLFGVFGLLLDDDELDDGFRQHDGFFGGDGARRKARARGLVPLYLISGAAATADHSGSLAPAPGSSRTNRGTR